MKLNRGSRVSLAVALVVIFLLVVVFLPPPSAHEVHTDGGTTVKIGGYPSNDSVYWQPGPPSQSLADMRCFWRTQPAGQCSTAFPGLRQTEHTLYWVWTGCIRFTGRGPEIDWTGFNTEYFAADRTLVVHCYTATGWVNFPGGAMGMATVTWVLLVVPTSDIGPGKLRLQEDDRFEHLLGENSHQFDLVTVQVS